MKSMTTAMKVVMRDLRSIGGTLLRGSDESRDLLRFSMIGMIDFVIIDVLSSAEVEQ